VVANASRPAAATGAVGWILSSSAIAAAALSGRSDGFFASRRPTNAASAGEIGPCGETSGGGAAFTCCARMTIPSPEKGGSPVIISWSITPTE